MEESGRIGHLLNGERRRRGRGAKCPDFGHLAHAATKWAHGGRMAHLVAIFSLLVALMQPVGCLEFGQVVDIHKISIEIHRMIIIHD